MIAEHLFDQGRFLGVESAAEGRNDRLDVHTAKSALPMPVGGTRLAANYQHASNLPC